MSYRFRVGDRVYYRDNGPSDTGVVKDIIKGEDAPYLIVWDSNTIDDRERTDQFARSQLELCEESP